MTPAGLCEECRHMAVVRSDRGSVFLRCELAKTDSRFAKYPRLPVWRCDGHAPAQAQQTEDTP